MIAVGWFVYQKKDNMKIQQIVDFINEAMDWQEEVLPREKSSVIDFGDMNIKVFYENEKEIYFLSEKSTKWMKPEPDFLNLQIFLNSLLQLKFSKNLRRGSNF